MPRQLTQAEIDKILFNQRMGLDPRGRVPMPSIQNLQQKTSGTITPINPNTAQLAAGGAGRVAQFLNQILPNAQQVVTANPLNLEALFPTTTAPAQVTIPTGFNFAPKQQSTGEVLPGGLQTNQVNLNQLLSAIKPADVLGVTGAQQAYTDVGMGKAPNPMDVLDMAGLGAIGYGVGRTALKGTASAGKYIAPTIGDLLDDYAAKTGLQMYVYRPTSPSNPDPLVGTQFKREDIGGLVNKTINDLSNKQGASLLFMPWDNSSRNMKITQVSGVDIPHVITHGGQNYILDTEHIKKGIGGASGKTVAEKIVTRDAIARKENLEAGGTGEVISTPITMAQYSENYSVQPTQVLLGLIDRNPNSPQIIPKLNERIQNTPKFVGTGEKRRVTYPFKDFAGVETELGRLQLFQNSAAGGDLRKAFVANAYGKSRKKGDINFQKEFGFNAEDIENAIGDPALAGLPRGYGGNAFVSSGKEGIILKPSKNATYNTDLTNMEYLGGLGYSAPVEIFMGPQYTKLAAEQMGKVGDLRSHTIGAIEKRKAGVSTMIDDAMLRRLEDYKKGLLD
jgi:hypothetical protein